MDDANTGIEEAVATISSGDQFAGFLIEYNELIEYLKKANNDEKQERIKLVSKKLNSISGASKVKSLLNKARKEFKKGNDLRANKYLYEAGILIDKEISWREKAVEDILPTLIKFQSETANNIGLRGQDRLPSFLVPRISRCRSVHQDISLYF